jgi:hypothetical protein
LRLIKYTKDYIYRRILVTITTGSEALTNEKQENLDQATIQLNEVGFALTARTLKIFFLKAEHQKHLKTCRDSSLGLDVQINVKKVPIYPLFQFL